MPVITPDKNLERLAQEIWLSTDMTFEESQKEAGRQLNYEI